LIDSKPATVEIQDRESDGRSFENCPQIYAAQIRSALRRFAFLRSHQRVHRK